MPGFRNVFRRAGLMADASSLLANTVMPRPFPPLPRPVTRRPRPCDDPAHAEGTDEEKLAMFRRVRDEIRGVFEAYAAGRLDVVSRARP